MALSTRTELIAAVQDWLAETSTEVDLASVIPDFITLLEADLNNDPDFRLLDMQKVQEVTPLEDETKVVLPTDYLQMDYLTISSSPDRQPLTYKAPRDLIEEQNDVGYVRYYSIIGGELWVYPAFGASETMEMGFYVKIPALTASNETNWLLTKHPGVYLYGCILKAEPYLHNDDRMTTWNALFMDAKQKLIDQDRKARSTAAGLQVSLPVDRVA